MGLFGVPFVVGAEGTPARFTIPNPEVKLSEISGDSIGKLIVDIASFATVVVGVVAIILILWAGLVRITAGGDSSKVEESSTIMWSAMIGLGIVLTSVVLLNAINPDLTKFKPLEFDKITAKGDGKKIELTLTPGTTDGKGGIVRRTGGRASGVAGTSGYKWGDGTGPALDDLTLTSYWPVKGTGTKTTEGGLETSQPGPDGKFEVCTLEMYYQWTQTGVGRCNYVTLASAPERYGEWYTITKRSWVNANGEARTLENIPALVHDTGSAFRGRPDKFDFATDTSNGDRQAAIFDRRQPINAGTTLIPRRGLSN